MLASKRLLTGVFTLLIGFNISLAQPLSITGQSGNRVFTTAAPFLMITPDARTAGLGEAGVAISADANAVYWNPAKLSALPEPSNISLSYVPWLSQVVNNMMLLHVSLAQKLSTKSAVGMSVSSFTLGDIQLTNPGGTLLPLDNAYDRAITLSYAYRLNDDWHIGASGKYIESNYVGTISISGNRQNSFNLAADLGAWYENDISLFEKEAVLALGMSISNLGPKMSYFGDKYFLPANLNIGSSLKAQFNPNHSLSWSVNFSKLLVPTPPIYEVDQNGQITGGIVAGKDPNRGWFRGTFGSFADAPDGFSEELNEVRMGTGLEYGFREFIALRAGYYHEAEDKGDRQYFTTGLGLRYRLVSLDLSYLFPSGHNPGSTHPLQNTLRVSLQFRFGNKA